MMNPGKQVAAREPVPGRLSLKLTGLFAISFALFFMLFVAYELLTSFADRSATAMQPNEEVRQIVVDPKIAEDLAKVLATDTNAYSQDVRDAFTDRGGLSGRVTSSSTVASSIQSSENAASTQSAGSTKGATGPLTSNQPALVAVEGTKQRYETWLGSLSLGGDLPLDPRVFAIEDLLPVGIVDGGNGQQEVMFFSQAAEKTVSFPLGTMFYDGWLTELRPEGVVFSSNDERRTVRMRSWARNIKAAG